MLEPIMGSINRERTLIFILARRRGYATEIARCFDTDLYAIQTQLDKLESGGVLTSYTSGRIRLYEFDQKYPFLEELKALVEKALSFYPQEAKGRLLQGEDIPDEGPTGPSRGPHQKPIEEWD